MKYHSAPAAAAKPALTPSPTMTLPSGAILSLGFFEDLAASRSTSGFVTTGLAATLDLARRSYPQFTQSTASAAMSAAHCGQRGESSTRLARAASFSASAR